MLSSIKSFVIAFVVSILVFGTLGYYAYPYVQSVSDGFLKPGAETDNAVETDTEPVGYDTLEPDDTDIIFDPRVEFEGQKSFTLLLIGSDYQPNVFSDYRKTVQNSTDIETLYLHQRHYRADVIVIVRYCAERGEVIFSAVPSNLEITASGIKMQLAEVLEKKDIIYFIGAVESVTGLSVDHYVYCQISLMTDVINWLGGIKFDVPVDMEYVNNDERIVEGGKKDPTYQRDSAGELILGDDGYPILDLTYGRPFRISLKKGVQQLNGEKATWVLRYNSYMNGYQGYRATQANFFKALFEQFMKQENRALIKFILDKILAADNGSTNIDEASFEEIADTLLNYPAYEKAIVDFPGSRTIKNGVETFSFNTASSYSVYAKYKLQ